ncbi:hypothetical protein PUN28_005947 [Cardiocondyla obscurior]|uniref:Uncharacterized protein n=1 Tax=Cardiocondyla obscurior TaxID=286306 RepID=A0AAW2G6Y6_9HYME
MRVSRVSTESVGWQSYRSIKLTTLPHLPPLFRGPPPSNHPPDHLPPSPRSPPHPPQPSPPSGCLKNKPQYV